MFKTELTEFKSLIEDEFRIKSNISIKHIEITVATQLVNNLIWKIIWCTFFSPHTDKFRIKSNISIKHIEITVATQLVNHLIWKIIWCTFFSPHTDKVIPHIQHCFMYKMIVILVPVPLDLSATFDTTDYEILLNKLFTRCSVGSTALLDTWLHSNCHHRI